MVANAGARPPSNIKKLAALHAITSTQTMDFSQPPSSSSTAARSKARSKACLHCKRRKMRCDGARPACFQCIRAERSGECAYGDDLSKSETQILYERLASLEKRYRDLQALKGHSKYGANGTSRQVRGQSKSATQLPRSNSVPGHGRGAGKSQLAGRSCNGAQTRGNAPLNARSRPLSRSESPRSETSDGSYEPHPFTRSNGLLFGEPADVHNVDAAPRASQAKPTQYPFGLTQQNVNHLTTTYAAHAQQTGVAFIVECQNPDMSAFPKAFTPLFFLWSIHFSGNPELQRLKPDFLDLVLDTLSELLKEPLETSGTKDGYQFYNLWLAILIHTSLATYFFSYGRMLEGNYHSNNASQLSICAGLHRTIGPRLFLAGSERDGETSPGSPGAGLLPKPRHFKDVLFRHYQFWNMFVLDRSWSTAGGAPSPSWRWGSSGLGFMSPEGMLNERSARTTVKTPWPEDVSLIMDAPSGSFGAPATSEHPVDDFLAGIDQRPSLSVLHLRAKSAALFEASSRISSFTESAGGNNSEMFERYQRTLSTFLLGLPPISGPVTLQPPSFQKSSLSVTHTMTHAAVIRLNMVSAERAYHAQPVPEGYTEAGQVVMDTLMSYDRMLGNAPLQDGMGFMGESMRSTLHSSVAATGPATGAAVAAAEICLSSARQMTGIISYLAPVDYIFLEPIIACCWDLAGQIFLQEVEILGVSNSHRPEFQNLISELGIIDSALRCLGETFPIEMQADKLTSHLRKVISPAPMPMLA